MRSHAIGVSVVLACLFTVAPAVAAPPKPAAAQDLADAKKRVAARDFAGAADAYASAFARGGDARWLFQAARARKRAGELARAANTYARYLKEAKPTAKDRGVATKELAALRPKLGELAIEASGAEAINVDQEPVEASASSIFVTPGPHRVEATFAGRPAAEATNVETGQRVSVRLTAPPPEEEPPPPPPPPEAVAVTPAGPTGDRSSWPRPVPPLAVAIGGGAAVLFCGLAIVSGLDVVGQKETYDADPSRENFEDGKGKQVRTNILWIVGGTLAVATAVAAVGFVDWKGKGKGKTKGSIGKSSLKVGAGLGSVLVEGAF